MIVLGCSIVTVGYSNEVSISLELGRALLKVVCVSDG